MSYLKVEIVIFILSYFIFGCLARSTEDTLKENQPFLLSSTKDTAQSHHENQEKENNDAFTPIENIFKKLQGETKEKEEESTGLNEETEGKKELDIEKIKTQEKEEFTNNDIGETEIDNFFDLFHKASDIHFSSSVFSSMIESIYDILSFGNMPYVFNTIFSPLAGLLNNNDSITGRITTIVDNKKEICIVNFDMSNLPPSNVMDVKVENNGNIIMHFSNEQLTSIDEEKFFVDNEGILGDRKTDIEFVEGKKHLKDFKDNALTELMVDKNDKVVEDKKIGKKDNEFDSISLNNISVSNPKVLSNVEFIISFTLDDRCDAVNQGIAKIDENTLIIKFPLKKSALNTINNLKKDACGQENKANNVEAEEKFLQKRRVPYVSVFDTENKSLISENNTPKPITKQIENVTSKKSTSKIEEEKKELSKKGRVHDPLYENQPGARKTNYILPFVKLEEF